MNDTEILDRIKDIMLDVFDEDELDIGPSTTAHDIEGWDSLSHIRLVVAIEREFGIKFANSEIEKLENVGDLVAAVAEKSATA